MAEKRKRILIIDDDEDGWRDFSTRLRDIGYQTVMGTARLTDFAAIERAGFDLVILDENVSGSNYLEFIKTIRARLIVPLIVVSERENKRRIIIELEVGADDVIVRPIDFEVLAARVQANIRQVERIKEHAASVFAADRPSVVRFDQLELNLDRYELRDENGDGEEIKLTYGEMELLILLAMSPGKVVSRETIFKKTRGNNHQSFDRGVDVMISKIRQKLDGRNDPALDGADQENQNSGDVSKLDGNKPTSLIRTIRGVGYMLDCDDYSSEP